jgi:opacity protein-like surface antigen
MSLRRAVFGIITAGALLTPASASAQQSIGIRGYVMFGIAQFAATDTFEAVADLSQQPIFGGGVQVTNIWRGIFADLAVSQIQTIDGERVFVNGGEVFELNIPLDVKMRPVDVAAGWRLTHGRFSPYVGAGVTYLTYEERSDFAESGDNVNESRSGPLVLGGVDVVLWNWLHAGGEFRYRQVKGILGEGGVSEEFGEDNAGGFTAAVRISIGR